MWLFGFNIVIDIAENIVGTLGDEQFDHFVVGDLHCDFKGRYLAVGRIGRAFHHIEYVFKYLDFSRVDGRVDHRDVAEHTIDVDSHLFFAKVLDEFHVAVSDCVHEGVPVVGGGELVDEMGEGVEKIHDLFGVSLFLIVRGIHIQQNTLVT